MTFEEWIKDQPDGYYSSDAIFQAGAASRDAEVARLRAINSKLCEKSNWYVIHTARLEEERDQLRAQINVLREALKESYPWERHFQEKCDCQFCQVLAATEPKS